MTTTELAPEVLEELELTIEHFNADHPDTVLFVARFAADRPDADDAEIASVDSGGVDFRVAAGGATGRARLHFTSIASTAAEVREQLLATIGAARANAGEGHPLTSLEREYVTNAALPTLVSTVVDVRSIGPNLREVVVEGGLETFASRGGDQFVYLMVPRIGGPPVPDDHTVAAQQSADPATAPHGAYYTVRSWDPDRARLTMWGVLHGHDDGVGGWLSRCQVGERVALWGPREGVGARPEARSHLFVADESGLAAVAAILDELPSTASAHVIVETIDRVHEIDLPGGDDVRVTWLHRGAEAPGTTGRLLAAVKDTVTEIDGLVAFGAAESREVSAIRRYLRHDLGMSAAHVSMTGYWRRRGTDHA